MEKQNADSGIRSELLRGVRFPGVLVDPQTSDTSTKMSDDIEATDYLNQRTIRPQCVFDN